MVILSAAVTTKAGKVLIARQFREISRIRIEGLLAAFPKLIGTDSQHTYVETDSVRYVYQPVETLYVLLITTKNSNIVEDLETLRLLGKILPEYSPGYGTVDEETVMEAAFEIIYSFDEVIDWGGYRENINLQQIATFTEMYSHEERLANMIKESKMQEAKEERKRREQEINKQRNDGNDRLGMIGNEIGKVMKASGMGHLARDLGFTTGPRRGSANADAYTAAGGISSDTYQEQMGLGGALGIGPRTVGGFGSSTSVGYTPSSSSYGRNDGPLPVTGAVSKKGMSLGKGRKEDSLLSSLRAEGEVVDSVPKHRNAGVLGTGMTDASQYVPPSEAVHLSTTEKLNLVVSKDGGVQSLDIKGDLMLRIADRTKAAIRVALSVADIPGLRMQTHPNIDKTLYASQKVLGLKNANRPFPTGNPVGVLRWTMSSKDESMCPILITCWPSDNGNESQVNIDYELGAIKELQDVVITVPVGTGNQPTLSQCDGEFLYNTRTQNVEWRIPMIDSANPQGNLEFTTAAVDSSNFFPVNVSFTSKQTYANISVQRVFGATTNESVQFSQNVSLIPETFSIA